MWPHDATEPPRQVRTLAVADNNRQQLIAADNAGANTVEPAVDKKLVRVHLPMDGDRDSEMKHRYGGEAWTWG